MLIMFYPNLPRVNKSLFGFPKATILPVWMPRLLSNLYNLCQWLSLWTFPWQRITEFYPPNFTLSSLTDRRFLISACGACHRLTSDWEITRGDWRNKEKIGHLSSPNNHWQHRNNKLGQQKCIPHARVGLVGHLSWHSSSLALLPRRSPFFPTYNWN